jgi:hypothetical protein
VRKSARDRLLLGLQAYTPMIADLPPRAAVDPGRPALGLMLNPALTMSAGKALAQIGHGTLMAADRWAAGDPAGERAWGLRGAPCLLLPSSDPAWAELRGRPDVSLVVDGGLTELAAGSETVLALALG